MAGRMFPRLIDLIGVVGATLTTVCWLPQALKILREKDTGALSLPATASFTFGIGLWLVYGLAINDWPLIGSNAVTLALMAVILAMKLRYGVRPKKFAVPGEQGQPHGTAKGCYALRNTTEAGSR